MSFSITCNECGSEVAFAIHPNGESMPLTETCDCGAVWRVEARKIASPEVTE